MLLDILNTNNYISFNISLAQIFGLKPAIYCSELLNIYQKAEKKNKLFDKCYFKIDRKYIHARTTLTIDEQLTIDSKWSKIGLLKINAKDPNIVSLDISMLLSIGSNEDEKLIKEITKKVKIKTQSEIKETKRMSICRALKEGIVCSNLELSNALKDWIDSIYSNPKGYLSKTVVKTFQDTLNSYAKGDLDLALQIVKIATIQGYKDCTWAINIYERDAKIKKQNELLNSKLPRVTHQRIATKTELSNKIYK